MPKEKEQDTLYFLFFSILPRNKVIAGRPSSTYSNRTICSLGKNRTKVIDDSVRSTQ